MQKPLSSYRSETRIPYVFQGAPLKTGKLASAGMIRITFDVPTRCGNALVAAIEEVRTKVGARLEVPSAFPREDALTMASIGLAALAHQLRAQGFREDMQYGR